MPEPTGSASTPVSTSQPAAPAQSSRTVMPPRLAALCLVTTVALTAVSVAFMPDLPTSNAGLLASLAEAPVQSAAAAACFTLSQLFFVGAVLAVGDLARARAPRVVGSGMILATIGAFGHSVFGGLRLALFGMLEESGREQYAAAMDRTYDSPVMLFAALGMLGTVFGILLLAVGLLRGQVVAAWNPLCLIAFLILELVGSNLSSWASLGPVALYTAAMLGLAAASLRGW